MNDADPARDSAPKGRIGALANAEEIIACTALAVVVGAVCWTVITRYLTEQPATWAGEISAMAFCWMVFVGAAACFKRGLHISIDMLVAALPRRPRLALAAAVDLLVAAFLVYVTVLAIDFTIESWTTPMPSLRWSYSWYYAGAALGLALMSLRHAQAALARRRAERG